MPHSLYRWVVTSVFRDVLEVAMIEMVDDLTGPDTDARRLAVEAIATLIYIKKTAAGLLLRPAGLPEDLVHRFLNERDPNTGEKRSKRAAASVVLDALARRDNEKAVIRTLVAIVADWDAFHLANDEYKARATVQKARELRGILIEAGERERREQERRLREATDRRRQDKEAASKQASALLLAQFEQAAIDPNHQSRGYLLQDLLGRVFDLHEIPVLRAFQRNAGGEQIDAAFEMEGWHYIVECRWRAKLANIRELDGLSGQVSRSGRQTMGLFLSIEGWSENVVPLLKQNPSKSIILMEGFDLRMVLSRQIELRALLKAKLSALNLEAEPYLSVSELLSNRR